MSPLSPVILALDVPDSATALGWVNRLQGQIGWYKVGMQLFYAEGPDIVRHIRDAGGEVFLDLKLHDIPHTVARACESVISLGAGLLTLHASGGREMLAAARAVTAGSPTRLLGVTALTSMNTAALSGIYPGTAPDPADWALSLAGLALDAGLDGLVCSGQENCAMRERFGEQPLLVNPGIRLPGGDRQDQQRVMTPGEAIAAGGSMLVVGRPILQAAEPLAALQAIADDLTHANRLPA